MTADAESNDAVPRAADESYAEEPSAKQQRLSPAGCDVGDPLKAAAEAQQAPGGVLLLDGGLATHIEALGENIDHSLWSARALVTNPTVIRQAHADYFAAGADVAITASYQAHLDGFKELGVSEADAIAAMQRSVRLAREAATQGGKNSSRRSRRLRRLVAGSVGSYGASLHNGAEYSGEFPPETDEMKLLDWHRPRARALIEAGCDMLACETIPCLMEARALKALLLELRFPAWVTFSCKSESEVSSGEAMKDCVAALADCEYVIGVGVNCSDPQFVAALVTICRASLPPSKHVVVYPNSGEVWCGETHTWKSGTATADAAFVEMAKDWIAKGADCVGGCCRTSPATIAALRGAFPLGS
jgi:homocysteine S-methyltransferase